MNATSRAIKKHADDLEAELAAVRAQLLVLESELGVARSLAKEALDQIAAKDAALRPLAALQIPAKPQGNAGAYSIFHKDIEAAREALATPARETE